MRRYHDDMRGMLDQLRKGATIRAAAGSVGIPESTWHNWRSRVDAGTMEDERIVALVRDVRIAYELATADLEARVAEASRDDWRAAAWALDHRRGDPKARHDERRARWEAEIAAQRAKGTHVERVAVDGVGDELIARLRKAIHDEP